tara:strand:+ start:911 stop:1093 length:183 start_codon:yes stop_codon:yes gene_type:complete
MYKVKMKVKGKVKISPKTFRTKKSAKDAIAKSIRYRKTSRRKSYYKSITNMRIIKVKKRR